MHMALGYYFAEVGIALRIFCQKYDALATGAERRSAGLRELNAEDWLYILLFTFAIEPYEAAHAIDVGKGNGAHVQGFRAHYQIMHRAYAGVKRID